VRTVTEFTVNRSACLAKFQPDLVAFREAMASRDAKIGEGSGKRGEALIMEGGRML
jgi:hypothetical protein